MPNDKNDTLCSDPSIQCITPYAQTRSFAKDSGHPNTSPFDQYLNIFQCAQTLNDTTECKQNSLILPAIGNFRNYPISNNSNHFEAPPPSTFNEVCFFNNSLNLKSNQSIDLQVKLYEATTDYFMYVWYSDAVNSYPVGIVGSFQLNSSTNTLQDGYTVKKESTLFILLIRNITLTGEDFIKNPSAGIQISLFDRLKFFGVTDATPTVYPEVPWTVIIVAGSIGGLITTLCICASVYIIVKSCKKQPKPIQSDERCIDQDEDRLSSLVGIGSDTKHQDLVSEYYDTRTGFTPKPSKTTVKVQPQRQKQADENLAYGGDIEMTEYPQMQLGIASFRPTNQTNSHSISQVSLKQEGDLKEDQTVVFNDPDASMFQLNQRHSHQDEQSPERHQLYTMNTESCMVEQNTEAKLTTVVEQSIKGEVQIMQTNGIGHELFYNEEAIDEEEEEYDQEDAAKCDEGDDQF